MEWVSVRQHVMVLVWLLCVCVRGVGGRGGGRAWKNVKNVGWCGLGEGIKGMEMKPTKAGVKLG